MKLLQSWHETTEATVEVRILVSTPNRWRKRRESRSPLWYAHEICFLGLALVVAVQAGTLVQPRKDGPKPGNHLRLDEIEFSLN